MGFEEALIKTVKQKKIRKTMEDSVDMKYPRLIINSLQWISSGYSSALYFAGKKLGKDILSKEIASRNIKDVLKDIVRIFKEYGIGTVEIKEMEENNASIILKESVSSYGMKEIGKPICFFESGLIAGIVEGCINKKVTVNEVLCGGLGDEYDEFLIRF